MMPSGPPPAARPGDANGDGGAGDQDLLVLVDAIVLGAQPAAFENADAVPDGQIDLQDLSWLIDRLLR